jgi:hypothetical protein
MKCPHCNVGIHENVQRGNATVLAKGVQWTSSYQTCPECNQDIVYLECLAMSQQMLHMLVEKFIAYPANPTLRPLPPEVPDPYRQDFVEAVAVLHLSAKASAALSRRNLQAIIHDKAGIKKKDLNLEIQALIDSGTVPTFISESLDAVRVIGNFAAHPIKSASTGEIFDVLPGEAEWNLDALESLFDFYFVQPALTAKRRAALDAKLAEANKPPLK